MEREIKLEVLHPELWEEILHHPLVDSAAIAPKEMHAIYYDSADGALRAAGIAYRVRKEGRDWVATVKLAGSVDGGLHQRPEWNQPVRSKKPDLGVFAVDEALMTVLAPHLHRALVPVMETVFQRREHEVRHQDARILLAADWGEIRAAGQQRPIHEIELELVDGELADLLQLASTLCASLPLCPDDASKLARGSALLGKEIPVARSKAPTIRGRDNAGDALGRLLLYSAQSILGGLAWLQLDECDALHQLRKEVRALRALLRFSKGADPEDRLRGVRNGLAVWFHEQSLQRDLDALAEHWQSIAPRFSLPATPLREALHDARKTTRDPRVDSRARLAAELLALWSQVLRNPPQNKQSLRSYVEERLQRMDEHLLFVEPEQTAQFHRLRIALKNLRDTLRHVSELWPNKDTKAFGRQLHALLDAAGIIRDAQVAHQDLPQLFHAESRHSALGFSAGILLGYLEARRERESKRFGKHWERFRQAPALGIEAKRPTAISAVAEAFACSLHPPCQQGNFLG
ncbi:CHAD domain-containing protein [Acidithiobacillus sp. AMEEHan]|uniref:CYTH and CHAD domain-containing protein n=1 Tax=Acidithiobacillus sp. AMEEHan TaxID=2994951 RepID=UPI0027E4E13B|nr:CHAD domain-containing protein [Acidithiobacillus sp. AMEEHan]